MVINEGYFIFADLAKMAEDRKQDAAAVELSPVRLALTKAVQGGTSGAMAMTIQVRFIAGYLHINLMFFHCFMSNLHKAN